MAAFAQFASDLDASTQKLLARGARLTELLKQPQFRPMPVEEQVVSIFAGVRGFLDGMKVEDINRFEAALLEEVRAKQADILEAVRKERELSKATEDKLTAVLTAFTKTFA
jgi:F-type H+-transporting ATPase subunit alpha